MWAEAELSVSDLEVHLDGCSGSDRGRCGPVAQPDIGTGNPHGLRHRRTARPVLEFGFEGGQEERFRGICVLVEERHGRVRICGVVGCTPEQSVDGSIRRGAGGLAPTDGGGQRLDVCDQSGGFHIRPSECACEGDGRNGGSKLDGIHRRLGAGEEPSERPFRLVGQTFQRQICNQPINSPSPQAMVITSGEAGHAIAELCGRARPERCRGSGGMELLVPQCGVDELRFVKAKALRWVHACILTLDTSARAEISGRTIVSMGHEHVVELGKLLSDHTRIALLDALFDGRAYTVTELARHVGVATSTCSEHLGRLLDGDLVAIEPQGRHRYYRLAGPEAAALLESMFEFGHGTTVRRSSTVPSGMTYARSCYDHLAGTLAVSLTDHLLATDVLVMADGQPALTDHGRGTFEGLGISTEPVRGRRPVVRTCLDWSERRPHLAGSVPAGLLTHMLDEGWMQRPTGRALWLTDLGRAELHRTLAFTPPPA